MSCRASVWLLLGFLALRALVPAGFMLAPEAGGFAFVLCSADMPMGHSQASQHHEPPPHTRPDHPPDPTCPYAQSAGPAPLPTFPSFKPTTHFAVLRQPAAATQVFTGSGPRRQPSSRGPPLLS